MLSVFFQFELEKETFLWLYLMTLSDLHHLDLNEKKIGSLRLHLATDIDIFIDSLFKLQMVRHA